MTTLAASLFSRANFSSASRRLSAVIPTTLNYFLRNNAVIVTYPSIPSLTLLTIFITFHSSNVNLKQLDYTSKKDVGWEWERKCSRHTLQPSAPPFCSCVSREQQPISKSGSRDREQWSRAATMGIVKPRLSVLHAIPNLPLISRANLWSFLRTM